MHTPENQSHSTYNPHNEMDQTPTTNYQPDQPYPQTYNQGYSQPQGYHQPYGFNPNMAQPHHGERESNMHDIYNPQETIQMGGDSRPSNMPPSQFADTQSINLKPGQEDVYAREEFVEHNNSTDVKDQNKVPNKDRVSMIGVARRVTLLFCNH
jgi:hypothetical protein